MQKINIIVCPGEEDASINMANAIADLIHQKIMNLPEESRGEVYNGIIKLLKEFAAKKEVQSKTTE